MKKGLYADDAEMKRHMNAIHVLEVQTGAPPELVTGLYENALERLKAQARIKDFLTVFASREVKEAIKSLRPSTRHH